MLGGLAQRGGCLHTHFVSPFLRSGTRIKPPPLHVVLPSCSILKTLHTSSKRFFGTSSLLTDCHPQSLLLGDIPKQYFFGNESRIIPPLWSDLPSFPWYFEPSCQGISSLLPPQALHVVLPSCCILKTHISSKRFFRTSSLLTDYHPQSLLLGDIPKRRFFGNEGGTPKIKKKKDLAEWSVVEVGEWLEWISLSHLVAKFQEEKIDGPTLLSLTDVGVRHDLGLKLGEITKLFAEREKLVPSKETEFEWKWREPQPFVQTTGRVWEYQPPENALESLNKALPEHYRLWKQGVTDKSHPLFLVFSGPGTGKSRLLDNLPELTKESVKSLPELYEVLDNAFTFKISFENGMRYSPLEGMIAEEVLGTRMMWQMSPMDSFLRFRDRKKKYSIQQALDAIPCSGSSKPRSVFLLVDGLQEVPHTSGSRDTLFADIIRTLCNYVNASRDFFVVGAVATTVSKPVDQVLHDSPQKRCYLHPDPLDGHAILKSSNMFIQMLVNDMGGHGRALEMLVESLQELRVDPDELEINLLASKLRLKLQGCYPSWFKVEDGDDLIPVFESALARQKFTSTNSHISSKFTVEDVVRLGLIRWNRKTHMLEVPFILFWLLTTEAPNASPVLTRLARDNVSSSIVMRTGLEGWRAWEEFIADFQSLKSKVFDGKVMTLEEFHAGAKLSNSAAKSLIKVREKNAVWTTKQYPSRSDKGVVEVIEHEQGEVPFKRLCDVLVVNGPNAPAADVFSCIQFLQNAPSGGEREEDGVWVNETFACRHRQKETLSQSDYENEREKAAGPDDFFMMFVTGDSNVNLESNGNRSRKSGLVDSKNFSAYFGPFAGRAFRSQEEPPNINTAPRSVLEAVEGIGPTRAKTILQERMSCPFNDLEDAANRTHIPEHIFNRVSTWIGVPVPLGRVFNSS